jgi:autotransporter-associated beta strand protein
MQFTNSVDEPSDGQSFTTLKSLRRTCYAHMQTAGLIVLSQTTNETSDPRFNAMKTQTIKISLVCLALLASAACLRAGTIIKNNNADNLNLTTSWVGGVVPGVFDAAKWDSTVTGANSVALGADTSWGGIISSNPAGPVTINAGNTLTLGNLGIDMSRASQNLTISSGLTLGWGTQRWNVTNGLTLTVNGTFSRTASATLVSGASTVAAASQGTVMFSPSLVNGVVPWATVQSSGAATNGLATGSSFATVSGGNIVAYTAATAETTSGTGVFFGGIPTGDNSTVNYDLGVASTGGSLTSDLYVNTLRNIGGLYIQPGTANFRANAIMNAGTGTLIIGTPVQQANTKLNVHVPTPITNELVLAAWTSGITFTNGIISDNVNPLRLTIGGTNNQSVLFYNQSTFSGGFALNSGRVGIGTNSFPLSGTVTRGPLGKGTITLNGGTLFATLGGFTIGNPIVVGPGGGALQYGSASPDLTINGNITGSGTLALNGVYNVNGLFLNGDDSAFTGTVIVGGVTSDSNNRLGTSLSGSALAKWVVNGALQAQFVGGTNYLLGELSGNASGGLSGHAGNTDIAIQNFIVGQLNTSSLYAGIIVNNAAGNAQTGNSDNAALNVLALTKVGTGTLTLSGANTYTGPTTISGGALQLGTNTATGVLSPSTVIQDNATLIINHNNTFGQNTNLSSSPIMGSGSLVQAGSGTTILTAANNFAGDTIVSGGTLLVNGSIANTATVMSGAKLGGNGTIGGVVTVQSGGQLGAGTPANIGTLTLNSTPVLGGSVFVKVNASTAQADRITVNAPVFYSGTLVVSNTGVPLLAGDTFTIVSATSHNGNFSSIVGTPAGTPGTGLSFTFANGVLSVINTGAYATNSTPTNITTTVTTIGSYPGPVTNTLTIAWPSDHTGWMLQSQTNNVDGSLIMNPAAWFDMPGSGSVNLLSLTNPVNIAVYFRMMYVAPPIPASAPTGLTARPTNTAVALNWTAPAFARSYNVKNSTINGGPYATVANTIQTSYTNFGLVNGTPYYFVVSALNYNGETTNSLQVTATPLAVPPVAPTNLTAQATHGLVQLNWSAAATAFNYNVKRSTTTGGPYTTIATVPVTSYSDTNGLVDGTTYYYVVSGINFDGEGPNSAETNATPTATPPAVPTNVVATGEYTQVRVTWTGSFGATSYNVKVATNSGGPYTTFTNTTATTVYNTGLANGVTNYYVVSSVNGIGESANSSEVNATTTTVLPLYYDFENTGAGYPAPPLPVLGDPSIPWIEPLPDPFYWASDPLNMGGTGSTAFSDWEHHRDEIKLQIENYEIGTKPVVDPSMIAASVSGSGTSRTLSVIVTNVVSGTNRTIALSFAITLPASGTNTWPVIIGMNSANGSVNASILTGVAKINYQVNQVSVYGAQSPTDPYYVFYAAPSNPALDPFNTGQYSAWAWGFSRIIDGLYKLNGNLGGGAQIDLSRIACTGCSYAGKMALFCGAFDERVTLTIAQESGGGGANSWRYNGLVEPAGSVEWLPNTDHNWFRESMFNYGAGTNCGFLPEDHHELCAMVAPRALFATGNDGQIWLGTPSCFVVQKAVEQIYNTFSISDRFGYNLIGDHAHCATVTNLDSEMSQFVNKFLLRSNNVNTLIRDYPTPTNPIHMQYYTNGVMVDDYNKIPAANWTAWWGTTNPIIGAMGPSCGTGQGSSQTPCP